MADCESLQAGFGAEPLADHADFERHAAGCAPCTAYRARLLRAEPLIARALAIEPAALAARGERDGPVSATGVRQPAWISAAAGLAAAVIAALTFWSFAGGSLRVPSNELAAAVVAHWEHEPDSLRRTDTSVSLNDLAEVMLGTAEMDVASLRAVSYVRVCRVGGRILPHLVVQGETGPYMVLLMPGETLASPVPLASADGGLAGQILPRGSGSIAVLGQSGAEFDEMASRVISAVDWVVRP